MASNKSIRCDEWKLLADADTLRMAGDTVLAYRRMANALATVFLTHWPEVHDLPVQDLESLFHDTRKTRDTPYGKWFKENHRKFPAYLRRAATMAAHGAVSSFMTRYRTWQSGDRRKRSQRPPTWGGINSWPTLYAANGGAGAMLRRVADSDIIEVKLFDKASGDWLFRKAAVVRRGARHAVPGNAMKSPSLIVKGGCLSLAQPIQFTRPSWGGDVPDRICTQQSEIVCAVDQGINKQATLSIVCADGTVNARKFVSLAAHIDRRDKVLSVIRDKAALTIGKGGKLSRGFCRTLYRRAAGFNLHIAREVSRQIHAFARLYGAKVIVFENLKGWRPKGGRKKSDLKAKFHGWLHRLVVQQAEATGEERGVRVDFVHPRGTSAWAYDGSGKVVRDRFNYGLARFASGKEYDCDLSASYNIAARWFVRRAIRERLKAERLEDGRQGSRVGRKSNSPARGKTPAAGPGTPVTLSSLWVTPLRVAA